MIQTRRKLRLKLLLVSGWASKFVNECNIDFMNHLKKSEEYFAELSCGTFFVQSLRDTILKFVDTSKETIVCEG